MSTNNTNRFVK